MVFVEPIVVVDNDACVAAGRVNYDQKAAPHATTSFCKTYIAVIRLFVYV